MAEGRMIPEETFMGGNIAPLKAKIVTLEAEVSAARDWLRENRDLIDRLRQHRQELLEANNRYLQRARIVESRLRVRPFENGHQKGQAIHDLAVWLYRYSEMFDFDNAALSDAETVAKELIG